MLLLSLLLALQTATTPPPAEASAEPPATPEPPAAPVPAADAPAARLEERTDGLHFTYSWSGDVQDVPALQSLMEGRRDRARIDATQAVEERPANDSGAPRPPYDFGTEWTTLGRSPALLVLAANNYRFTGGAHGNTRYEGLVWDMAAARQLPVESLFATTGWAEGFSQRYCTALDVLRAARRAPEEPSEVPPSEVPAQTTEPTPTVQPGASPAPQSKRGKAQEPVQPVATTSDPAVPDTANACPPIAEQVVLPVDGDGNGRFDRLRVLIPPYVAGVYAEGSYEPEVILTRADLAAIGEQWRESFEGTTPPAPRPRARPRTRSRR